MPQYERGHSGQEVGEMQQRLADLGYEVTPTNEFDEYTEDALRRYQTDWLYAEGTGVADEQTLTQLEYHHANRDPGTIGGPQFGEEPVYEAGAGGEAQVSPDGQHWWDGSQWNPFANPTPLVDEQAEDPPHNLPTPEEVEEFNRPFQEGGQIGGPQFGEEPIHGAGASASSDDGQWNPFANPTPEIDTGVISETYQEVKQEAGELWDGVVDEASKIMSGEEPLPDVRN